jgi:hypothetical protein
VNQSDDFRARRIAWRFKKSGGNGRDLRAIEDIEEPTRSILLDSAGLAQGEEAAVGMYRTSDDWLLFTSRRLVWQVGGNREEIALSAISDATIDPRDLATAGSKSRVDVITIVTSDGRRTRVPVESGSPLSGVWNALKMVAAWN